LAKSSWHDVSGVRLHAGKTAADWNVEPAVGPGDSDLVARLFSILIGASATSTVWVGQWDGFAAPDEKGAGNAQWLHARGRRYRVRELDRAEAVSVLCGPGAASAEPAIAWASSGGWLLNSDIDLPSTLVGCDHLVDAALRSAEELESVAVDPVAAIVA
jgi:hypothetical protein